MRQKILAKNIFLLLGGLGLKLRGYRRLYQRAAQTSGVSLARYQGYLFSVEYMAPGTMLALFSEAAGSPLCLEVAKSLLLAGL